MADDKKVTEAEIKEVSGGLTVQKQSSLSKIAKEFIVEDSKTVGTYVLKEVIIPGIKNMIFQAITNTLSMAMFKEGYSGQGKSSNGVKITDYNAVSKTTLAQSSVRKYSTFEFENIEFDNRMDADAVLESLRRDLTRYPAVSIADMYDYAKVQCNAPSLTCPFTYNKYGWSNLAEATTIRTESSKWMIQFPVEPTPLKR